MREARFKVLACSDDAPLVIRDLGPWDQHPTVTNDAEGVVARLFRDGLIPGRRRLLYFDSDGNLDELLHDGGKFAGFAPGPRGERP